MHEEQRSTFRNQMIEHREEEVTENNRVMQSLYALEDQRQEARNARERTLEARESERRNTWD